MARATIGVIVGYIVMFILQLAAFMTIYTVMGADWSFKPASYQASTRWTVMQFTVIFVTALIAGLICALISKGGKAPLVLAVVTLAIGFTLGAVHVAMQPADTHELRTASESNIFRARHPTWVIFAGPIIAAIGIGIGGKMKRRS